MTSARCLPPAARCPMLAAALSALAICLGLGGCTTEPPEPPAATLPARPPAAAAPAPTAVSPGTKTDRETWYVAYIKGAKVGYVHTAYRHETRDGRRLTRIDSLTHLTTKRGSDRLEMDLRFTELTGADGGLVEFESRISEGSTSIASRGRVVGNQLRIETSTQGKTLTSRIPWSAEYGGFSAVEQSLEREPMQPGQRRSMRALVPALNMLADIELVARDHEPVKLLTGSYELLRIDVPTRFPSGQVIRGTYWTDRTGQALKIYSEGMDGEMFLTTRETAQDTQGLGQLDFTRDVAVPVDRALPSPHGTKKIRYRLTLDRGDPAAAFVSGPSQQVKSIDPHTAEMTVYALRPHEAPGNPQAADDPPTDADRQPDNFIQSDDSKIVAAARKVAGDKKDPWQKALALEGFVNAHVTQKDFSKGFATAAEVIQTGRGDCTEHAMLLAALCRAAGIPARVAVGLVYHDRRFLFHMWTEVYVGKRWTPIDATLALGGIGAAHLKIAHSNLLCCSPFSVYLPVDQVVGRGLKIEVLEVE